MESEKQKILKEKINTFPPLQQPQAQREISETERMELVRLLMEYKRFDTRIRKSLQKKDGNVLLASEHATQATLYKKKSRTSQFDGVAFMEASDSAMRHFDPNAGTQFLTYFDRLYDQRLMHSSQVQTNIIQGTMYTKLSSSDVKLIKQTTRLMEQSGLTLAKLSPEFYRQLADEMNTSEEHVRTLLLHIYRAKHIESLYRPDADEDGEAAETEIDADAVLAYDFVDDGLFKGRDLERLGEIGCVLEAFADADAKEFPRLFMSNDILFPLKDIESDTVSYARLLLQHEDTFWQKIFEMNYLRYPR